MKKLIFVILFLLFLCFPVNIKAAINNSSMYNDINVYYFYEEDCKTGEKSKKWIDEVARDDSRMIIEYIDVTEDKKLLNEIKKALKIKTSSLPLTVIGSNYFVNINDKTKSNLLTAIESYEAEDKYCDVITKIRSNDDLKDCIKQNKGIYKEPNIFMNVIIITIISLAIIGLVVFIIIKKTDLLSRLQN